MLRRLTYFNFNCVSNLTIKVRIINVLANITKGPESKHPDNTGYFATSRIKLQHICSTETVQSGSDQNV